MRKSDEAERQKLFDITETESLLSASPTQIVLVILLFVTILSLPLASFLATQELKQIVSDDTESSQSTTKGD